MTPHSLPLADDYLALYKGKTLLIKASGRELMPDRLTHLCDAIRTLTSNGVYITLIFGGQTQIDQHWAKDHPEPRPKKDGIGITTPQVLADGVIPAFAQIREELAAALPDCVQIVAPESLVCTQVEDRGLVGAPNALNGIDDIRNKAFGFMGQSSDGQAFNVNGDDTTNFLVQQFAHTVDEVIMLTDTRGVVDDEAVVPIILSSDIREDGSHATIDITGGMLKKMQSVRAMLQRVSKVAMTTSAKLLEEIEDWKGSGTLCVNVNAIECSPMQQHERAIVEAVFADFIEKGTFRRPKTTEELEAQLSAHNVLRVGNSPLGGFSLMDRGDRFTELCKLWSGYTGNGLGQQLAGQWQGMIPPGNTLFAMGNPKDEDPASIKKVIDIFTRLGLQNQGRLEEVLAAGTRLPASLQEYEPGRNPLLFTHLKT